MSSPPAARSFKASFRPASPPIQPTASPGMAPGLTASRWRAAGNYIVIDQKGSGEGNMYAHLSAPSPLQIGDHVRTAQYIGNVGDTGDATGCHLHFEAWSAPGWYEGGQPYDPLPLLQAWDK